MTTFQPMPNLTVEQYDALKSDIVNNGIVVPVVVDQHGRVLDGHNRLAIAAELGIDCPQVVENVTDDDAAMGLAVTLNCARRHLTQEQKRVIIAAELVRGPDDSDRAIARRVGCDHKTVAAVRRAGQGGEIPQPHQVDADEAVEARARVEAAKFGTTEFHKHVLALMMEALRGGVTEYELLGALSIARSELVAMAREIRNSDDEIAEAFGWIFIDPLTAWLRDPESTGEWTREAGETTPYPTRCKTLVLDGLAGIASTLAGAR